MNLKHKQKPRELMERALDRVWQRSNEDAERNPGGERFELDQRLMADARLAGWKPPAERARRI